MPPETEQPKYTLEDWAKEYSRDWFLKASQHVPCIFSCIDGKMESAYVAMNPPLRIRNIREEVGKLLKEKARRGATELAFVVHDYLQIEEDSTVKDPVFMDTTLTEVLLILYYTPNTYRTWGAKVVRDIVLPRINPTLDPWQILNFEDPHLSKIYDTSDNWWWN
jgi:hypothetical protein